MIVIFHNYFPQCVLVHLAPLKLERIPYFPHREALRKPKSIAKKTLMQPIQVCETFPTYQITVSLMAFGAPIQNTVIHSPCDGTGHFTLPVLCNF